MAGRREINDLKPIDRVILGMAASHRAATKVNAEVAPKMSAPEAEPATVRVKAVWSVVTWLIRRPTPAG